MAIEIISTAKNRWDYEDKQESLWDAAQKYPKEMVESFYKNPDHQLSIAWCLAHVKNSIVKDFFIKEARNKNQYVRWYAIINLRKNKSKDMIEIFVQALKDRSSLVKGEALKAVKNLKDVRVEKALLHLVKLKSFKKNSPGYYDEAKKLLKSYKHI